jgi:hypothetical protein
MPNNTRIVSVVGLNSDDIFKPFFAFSFEWWFNGDRCGGGKLRSGRQSRLAKERQHTNHNIVVTVKSIFLEIDQDGLEIIRLLAQ